MTAHGAHRDCHHQHAHHHHEPSHEPGHGHRRAGAERATALVLALTLVTMVAEVGAGWWTGSMALLADGWHMGTHAAAMGVAVAAYRFARRHARGGRYRAAHRAGDLGGFANAVLLAVVAVMVGAESVTRLATPERVNFTAALWVAVLGLFVNLLSAWLLRDVPHDHGHDHPHDGAPGPDHNREAALVHVLSDALTSALAIAALWAGRRYGLVWLDPLTGLVGAAVILRWSASLLRRTGDALLERT